MKTVKQLIYSFKVNRLSIHIDSGNMALNGLLFPVFYHLGHRIGKDISVNFTGENRIILQIENNIARLAWAFFK